MLSSAQHIFYNNISLGKKKASNIEDLFNLQRRFFQQSVRKNYLVNLLHFGVKQKNLGSNSNEQGRTIKGKKYGVILYVREGLINLSKTPIATKSDKRRK